MPVLTSWSDQQLAELRWNTTNYIAEKPTTVVLTPTRKVAVLKPGGGHDYEPEAPKPAQTVRLIRQTNFDGIEYSPNDDGMSRKFGYVIVGAYDADIEIGDTFDEVEPDGSPAHYHVDSLEPYNGFEVRGTVTAFAKDPQHG